MTVLPRSLVLGLGLVAPAVARAVENDPPERCYDLNSRGDLPTCTYDGSSWEVTYPGSGAGAPGWVVWLAILAALAALTLLVWRLSRTRRTTLRAPGSR